MKKPLHIFKAGKRTTRHGQALEFSAADLAATADAYDPRVHEAPIVIGHPELDAPAHGWVRSLSADDVDLFAEPQQVEPLFAEDVEAGRFKKISAAFYPPDHPANPKPGVYYLRHVGFLGAQPPAVKGLKPVQFADDGEGLVTIEFGDYTDGMIGRALRQLREWMIGKFGQDEADKALPSWTPDELIEASMRPDHKPEPSPAYAETSTAGTARPTTESVTMTPEELAAAQKKLADDKAAQEAEFAEREQTLKQREAGIAESEATAQRAEDAAFSEDLVQDGLIPAAQKSRVVELLHASRRLDGELEFAEGDGKDAANIKSPARDAFADFLKGLPKQIEFGEVAGADKGAPADTSNAEALAQQAVEFVESQKAKGRVVSIAQAMDHITQAS